MTYKTAKIVYRVSTILLALFILPGVFFMNSEFAQQGMQAVQAPQRLAHLVWYGQPIAILLILLLPVLRRNRWKERAYVALGMFYVGALYAHLTMDGFVPMSFAPLVTLAILILSYTAWGRLIRLSSTKQD